MKKNTVAEAPAEPKDALDIDEQVVLEAMVAEAQSQIAFWKNRALVEAQLRRNEKAAFEASIEAKIREGVEAFTQKKAH